MGIRWRDFELPKKLTSDENSSTDTYGKFIAEPFERGYGTTLGNALRRVLISSIEGAAITSVKMDNVLHEFSTIPGVLEDTAQIILNLKRVVLRSHSKTPKMIHIKVDKKGEVTAGDIVADETIEVLNPDLRIATLTKKVAFAVEMEVGKGRGYVPAERNKRSNQPIGIVSIDSIFTPVKKVNFVTEETRVGQMTDYDRLILEIWTNGSLTPKEALVFASRILQKHLDIFANFGEISVEDEEEEEKTRQQEELMSKLTQPVSELELSVRSANCLREANIETIGELVKKTELEMLKYRNFGKKSLNEIGDILKKMELSFGIKIEPVEK